MGLVNKKGTAVIPPLYSGTMNFGAKLAFVRSDDKWGVINKKGETVIEATYLAPVSQIFYDDGFAVVAMDDKKYVMIDRKGKEISQHYDVIREYEPIFCEEEGCYNAALIQYGFPVCQEHLFGMTDGGVVAE